MAPDFKIHTSAMQIDPEHENIVRMVGSSTARDLHGDTMAISALTDMAQCDAGLTLWLNHSYDLPNDLFGSLQEKPELRLKEGIADLHIVSDVEMDNPAAVQTLKLVKNGRKLGCSIGCMVLEAEIDEENDEGRGWWPPIIILHVQVLEFSVVGIPANQRCWVEPATKGLFERMASEGRGDEALKLAPAVKGLYPRAYEDYLKTLDNLALRRDLECIEVKDVPRQRIEWMPNERVFAMSTKGILKPMERNEVTEILAKNDAVQETKRMIGWDPANGQESAVVVVTDGNGNILESKSLEDESLETKGASGKTTWPLADEDTAWDKGAAHKRIMDWAGGDDPDWSKVKSVHFWYGDEGDKWGDFKLPFCDKIGDEIKAVPRAIYACTGGHGLSAADIPESDVPAIKKKIEVYYHKLGKKAPWEEKEDDKEDAVQPDNQADTGKESTQLFAEVDVEQEPVTKEEAPALTAPLALPSDVALFNLLAARFDQPQISLDDQGRVQATKAFPELAPESVQEAIAKALDFGETIKSGSEFSAKNRKRLQDIHDGIVDMCKAQFHPCEEMAANDDEDDDDGKKKPEDEEDDDNKEITALIDTLAKHGIEPRAIKDLQGKIKDLQSQTKEAEETLAKLKDMPLGQPTRLNRSVRTGEDVVTYDDFKKLSAPTMGDNERRWTLEEALKGTIVISRDLPDGGTLNYRKWPDGVGGSVKNGVRPELTGAQRQWMHPMDQLSYNDGNEASVPCYDDPGGIQA
jgi:phage head maturation protease